MKRSGIADLPLHGGRVPDWLAQRMTRLGAAITEAIVYDYGAAAFLSQLSDPFDGNKHSLIIDLSRSSASFQSQNKSAGRCWQARRSDNSLTTGSVRRCLGTRYVRVAGITCPIESADAIPIPRISRQASVRIRSSVSSYRSDLGQ